MNGKQNINSNNQFSFATRAWAGLCHKCNICPYADRKPQSAFGKLMRWHRTWCPGWDGHTKVYGRKLLSQ